MHSSGYSDESDDALSVERMAMHSSRPPPVIGKEEEGTPGRLGDVLEYPRHRRAMHATAGRLSLRIRNHKHALVMVPAGEGGGWRCDVCSTSSRDISNDSSRWGCMDCDWDACEACTVKGASRYLEENQAAVALAMAKLAQLNAALHTSS